MQFSESSTLLSASLNMSESHCLALDKTFHSEYKPQVLMLLNVSQEYNAGFGEVY